MGTWFISLSASLVIVLIGLYIHWSVVLAGALLPFLPLLTELLRLRQSRRDRAADSADAADTVDPRGR